MAEFQESLCELGQTNKKYHFIINTACVIFMTNNSRYIDIKIICCLYTKIFKIL